MTDNDALSSDENHIQGNMLREKVEALATENESLSEKLKIVFKEAEENRAQLKVLQHKLDLQESVETLKNTDFKGLMDTNLQMAKSIESLVNKMQNETTE